MIEAALFILAARENRNLNRVCKKIVISTMVVIGLLFVTTQCKAECWDIITDGNVSKVCVEKHEYAPETPNKTLEIIHDWFHKKPETNVLVLQIKDDVEIIDDSFGERVERFENDTTYLKNLKAKVKQNLKKIASDKQIVCTYFHENVGEWGSWEIDSMKEFDDFIVETGINKFHYDLQKWKLSQWVFCEVRQIVTETFDTTGRIIKS